MPAKAGHERTRLFLGPREARLTKQQSVAGTPQASHVRNALRLPTLTRARIGPARRPSSTPRGAQPALAPGALPRWGTADQTSLPPGRTEPHDDPSQAPFQAPSQAPFQAPSQALFRTRWCSWLGLLGKARWPPAALTPPSAPRPAANTPVRIRP